MMIRFSRRGYDFWVWWVGESFQEFLGYPTRNEPPGDPIEWLRGYLK